MFIGENYEHNSRFIHARFSIFPADKFYQKSFTQARNGTLVERNKHWSWLQRRQNKITFYRVIKQLVEVS